MDCQALYNFVLECADAVPSDSTRFGVVLIVQADKIGWATFGLSEADAQMTSKDAVERYLLPAYMAATPRA